MDKKDKYLENLYLKYLQFTQSIVNFYFNQSSFTIDLQRLNIKITKRYLIYMISNFIETYNYKVFFFNWKDEGIDPDLIHHNNFIRVSDIIEVSNELLKDLENNVLLVSKY
jgi:hypothetical protein